MQNGSIVRGSCRRGNSSITRGSAEGEGFNCQGVMGKGSISRGSAEGKRVQFSGGQYSLANTHTNTYTQIHTHTYTQMY